MNTIAEVVQLMSSATSAQDWDNKCDQVKAAWGGNYPEFWFQIIVMSGIAAQTAEKWEIQPSL